ncbi:phage tail protein [bacterium]|nr:phage tail protein [bacterium]
MADLYLDFGTDLNFAPNGDVQLASGSILTNQRLARRFFTNPQQVDASGATLARADYIFHPNYGTGLGRYVDSLGNATTQRQIELLMAGQARLEASVAPLPVPSASSAFKVTGELDVFLRYATRDGGMVQTGFSLAP